jgi:cardiolipin synthase
MEVLDMLLSPAALAVVEALWVVAAACWILLERRSPEATLAWIFALAALPVIGIAVYLFFGPRRFARKKLRLSALKGARANYLEAWEGSSSRELTSMGQLARLAVRLQAPPPETARSLELYAAGDAFYAAVEAAIAAARHHVHVEMYIFERDRVGKRILGALAAAARRGVEVRLLVDAAGSPRLGARFLRPFRAAGVEIERFNPVLASRLRQSSANFRTHRKIVVCDGRVGFTGGINVADDHSAAASGAAAWRDTSVRIEGAAVHGLQLTFLENWAFATRGHGSPPTDKALRSYVPDEPGGDHEVQIVPSGPDQDVSAVAHLYVAAIAGAQERVWITTPYFVPDAALSVALTSAALRGVDVRLLLPARTDLRLVDAASRTYRDELLAAGARLWIYGPPMIHAKTCVIDEDVAVVGTANLDSRSLELNFEVTALLYGGPAVAALAGLFEADLAVARPLTARESSSPFLARLTASVARLFAPQL